MLVGAVAKDNAFAFSDSNAGSVNENLVVSLSTLPTRRHR